MYLKSKALSEWVLNSFLIGSLLLICRDGIILFRPAHLHNKFEENNVEYKGSTSTSEINDFITKN